jgi:hypothetical protein
MEIPVDTKAHGGIYQRRLSGPRAEGRLVSGGVLNYVVWDWSHDGCYLLYGKREPNGKVNLWYLSMDPTAKDREPRPLLASESNNTQARFSPDSRWVAYASDESGKTEIYVQPFRSSSNGGRTKVTEGGGTHPRWRRDGQEIFFVGLDGKLMATEVIVKRGSIEVGPVHPWTPPPCSGRGAPRDIFDSSRPGGAVPNPSIS